MKQVTQESDDFGLPKEVILESRKLHKKDSRAPLKERRKEIIAKARDQRSGLRPLYAVILAAAAIFIGVIYYPTYNQVDSTLQANENHEIETWLDNQYTTLEEPLEYSLYADSDLTLNWTLENTMALSDEELDILIQEWSIEMSEYEIYNLKHL